MISGKRKKVVIIDYHLGNLFSVKQACDTVGIDAVISSDKHEIACADALILPGVGAFIEAMKNLNDLNLIQPIKDAVSSGKPLFGICLGLQLLFTKSEEFGSGTGLDLIPGVIRKFPAEFKGVSLKVPQIQWNKINSYENSWEDTALSEISEGEFMYFVHSYYVDPAEETGVLTKTNYGGLEYCSSILKNNIFAVQFHPEKSADKGLSIYKNWAIINNVI